MTIIMLFCLVCVPPGRGEFFVFCALFCLPNGGQGYNEHDSLCTCNSLCAILLSDLFLSGEDLHGPPPCINNPFKRLRCPHDYMSYPKMRH